LLCWIFPILMTVPSNFQLLEYDLYIYMFVFLYHFCCRIQLLNWIFILPAHWNNSPRVDMSLHSDTLSLFRANQSLLILLTAACLVEEQLTPIHFNIHPQFQFILFIDPDNLWKEYFQFWLNFKKSLKKNKTVIKDI
jgi:hypothetical protein